MFPSISGLVYGMSIQVTDLPNHYCNGYGNTIYRVRNRECSITMIIITDYALDTGHTFDEHLDNPYIGGCEETSGNRMSVSEDQRQAS